MLVKTVLKKSLDEIDGRSKMSKDWLMCKITYSMCKGYYVNPFLITYIFGTCL